MSSVLCSSLFSIFWMCCIAKPMFRSDRRKEREFSNSSMLFVFKEVQETIFLQNSGQMACNAFFLRETLLCVSFVERGDDVDLFAKTARKDVTTLS